MKIPKFVLSNAQILYACLTWNVFGRCVNQPVFLHQQLFDRTDQRTILFKKEYRVQAHRVPDWAKEKLGGILDCTLCPFPL